MEAWSSQDVFQDDKLGQKTHGAPQPIDSEVFWRHYTIFAPFRQEKRTDAEQRPSSNSCFRLCGLPLAPDDLLREGLLAQGVDVGQRKRFRQKYGGVGARERLGGK